MRRRVALLELEKPQAALRQEGNMAQSEISQAVKRVWWALVIRGVLAIVLGIFIIARPTESVAAFALVIAIWAVVQGIVSIVHAIDLRSIAPHWWLLLLSGLISTGFGVAALYYYPGLSLTFAVVWTAWWLMLGGIAGISVAVQERRLGMSWGWTMALGVLGVAVAIYAFMSPPVTLVALMALISAYAIIGGVVLLVGAYRLRTTTTDVGAAVRGAYPSR
jgi:uncharacterized membrane protein HdeD (DUF308 family)